VPGLPAVSGVPLVFLPHVCYALSQTTNDAVNAACGGSNLWNFVLANCVLDFCVILVMGLLIVMGSAWSICFGGHYSQECASCTYYLLYAVYNAIFLGIGVPIYSTAISTSTCTPMLSDLYSTGTPLLTIFCVTYLVLSGIKTFFASIVAFCAYCPR